MAGFKVKHKDDHLFVRVKLSRSEAVSDAELEAFARIYIRGFLKPKKIRENLIEYTGPMGISLYERMKFSVTKHEFFLIVEQIIASYSKLRDNSLLTGRVLWDIHRVYYNESTKELQFLYIPFTATRAGGDILGLLDAVGYSAIPQPGQNSDYVSRFMFFLDTLSSFDETRIEKFIEHEDRTVVNTIKNHGAGQSGFMTDKPKDYYKHYADRDENAGDGSDPTNRLVEEENTRRLDEETGLLDEDESTGLPNDEEGTAMLNENQVNIRYPSLLRVLTEETVIVNKPVFRLGKGRSDADYFVTNNHAVSRSHADIITRGTRYFVMDLNSKNGTFINNQVIPAQQEVEIFDGNYLKLANEEFVFNV